MLSCTEQDGIHFLVQIPKYCLLKADILNIAEAGEIPLRFVCM